MRNFDIPTASASYHPFLSGGGEMGQLMRSKDWSQTMVGTPDQWPQSLRTAVSIILHSKFPMFLWWGPGLVCFYNDAYRPSLGEHGKHPGILGMPAEEAWPEIWHIIKPLIDQVLSGGESTWSEDQLIPIFRNGKIEDVYWTFSYSAVMDESGMPAGVFVTCSETTEKITTLKKLEENRDQLEFAIEVARLGTWDYNPLTGKFITNDRLKEWFGLPLNEETALDKVITAIAEKDRQRVVAAIEAVLDPAFSHQYDEEYSVINLVTKKEIVVQAKGRAWFNENNIAYRFNGTLEDVTEKVGARKRIEENERKFRNTINQAPIGICILRGKEFIVDAANQTYLDVVDHKEQDFVGNPLFSSLPEVKDRVSVLLNNVLETGEPYHGFEFPVTLNRFGKKETSYFDFVYQPLREADGLIAGIIVVATEVTASVNAKHNLAESERQFRNMVMQSPIPMTILRGSRHIIEMANTVMFQNLWRKKETDVIGKSILDVFPELNDQKYPALLNKVFLTGETHSEKESVAYVQGDDGMKKFYLDFEYAPLFDTERLVSGIIITVNDVTEKVEARLKVEESEKEFRQLADSLPELVWTTDASGKQTFASKRWKEFTGLDPYDETTFEKVVHTDDYQNIIDTWTGCLQSGNIYKAQARLKNREGNYEWFYVHGEPVNDETNQIEKWIGAFTNFNEQKKAEEALKENEKMFRDVANTAPVFIWLSGTDSARYFFNTAWLSFTGRTMEEEIGNGWMQRVHPDDIEHTHNVYLKAFEKQEEYHMEYRLLRHDGQYRWISARGVPRFTYNNIFEGYIGACMDIHEQILIQKKLREDEERLNIVITASDLGTWELNLKTMQVIYSDRYIQMLGYKKGTLLSHQQLLRHIHPDDMERRKQAFETAVATSMLQYEGRMIWNDGSVHWVENKGKLFYDDENKPHNIIGTTRDITDEKNYAQELLGREQKFRLLADSMPQFIWTGDAKGNLNYFNQSVYAYSGLNREQLEKEGWLQIVHPDDREENIKAWMHAISTGNDFIFEHRFGRYDGEYRWQLSRAIPQRDAAGNIQMWVGTSTDIQDIKEQEQQKDFFISMASHELKTPITSIKGYVQILQSTYGGGQDPFLKSSLNVIDKQILNLTKLIADLLDVSKIKAGSLLLNREDFELTELADDMIGEMKHINPEYEFVFDKNNPMQVHADKSRIGQVLVNFLTNAVKYSPASKTIVVKSFVQHDYATVTVQDSGIGISKADQEKIFERFYRVEGKNEKTFPGFGIGLFIASEIINKHFGKIGVTSEPGKGSVFYFAIPVKK